LKIDALAIGGDLTNAGSAADVERAIDSWRGLATRIFALAGNYAVVDVDADVVVQLDD
jgi:hypothetical protein